MPRDLYDCTAAELATHSVKHLQHDTPPSDAATWLTENGYDATPVYADDDPTGFIHKDDVTTDDDGNTLDDHLTPLTIDYMISGDTSFTAVLSALIENPSTSSVVPTTSPASSPAPTSTPPPYASTSSTVSRTSKNTSANSSLTQNQTGKIRQSPQTNLTTSKTGTKTPKPPTSP